MTLKQLTTKLELNILIEKILAKNGAYKTPTTKAEALAGVKLSDTTKATIGTLRDAIVQINQLYELSILYSTELKKKEQKIYDLSVENSKLKVKVNHIEQKNKSLLDHVTLNEEL